MTRKQQTLTISELQQHILLLTIHAVDALPRCMIYVESEQICQLEHFLGRELESGVAAPFQRCIRVSNRSAIERS